MAALIKAFRALGRTTNITPSVVKKVAYLYNFEPTVLALGDDYLHIYNGPSEVHEISVRNGIIVARVITSKDGKIFSIFKFILPDGRFMLIDVRRRSVTCTYTNDKYHRVLVKYTDILIPTYMSKKQMNIAKYLSMNGYDIVVYSNIPEILERPRFTVSTHAFPLYKKQTYHIGDSFVGVSKGETVYVADGIIIINHLFRYKTMYFTHHIMRDRMFEIMLIGSEIKYIGDNLFGYNNLYHHGDHHYELTLDGIKYTFSTNQKIDQKLGSLISAFESATMCYLERSPSLFK